MDKVAISHAVPHTFQSATANCIKVRSWIIKRRLIKIKDDSLQFSCTTGVGTKTYPRPVQAQYTAASGTTYDPTTGIMVVTTSTNHAIQVGDKIKFDDGATSFSCTAGSFPHTYVGGTVADAVTVVTDSNTKKSVTDASYNPTNGQVELTIGSHSYTTSDTVKITTNSLTILLVMRIVMLLTTHTQDLLILHTNKYYQFLLRLLLQLLLLLVLQLLLLLPHIQDQETMLVVNG